MNIYDDEYLAQADPQEFVFEMRDELVRLREWAAMALTVLQHGVELMPPDQLRQWEGVRSVIESAPVDN